MDSWELIDNGGDGCSSVARKLRKAGGGDEANLLLQQNHC